MALAMYWPRALVTLPFSAADAHAVGEFGRDFDERFRDELHIHRIIFRPVVIVLGQTVGGADDVEFSAVFAYLSMSVLYVLAIGLLD